MKRNPLIPFAVTAIIGILLMIGMSFYGLNKADEIVAEQEGHGDDAPAEVAEGPEGIYQQSCAACHGQDLSGGVGPALNDTALSKEEIMSVIANGQGNMPGGLVGPEQAEQIATWLTEGEAAAH